MHCCYGTCNSDKRSGRPGYEEGLRFFRFPQPCLLLRNNILEWSKAKEKTHIKSCKKCTICWEWLWRCRREDPKFQMVRQITYRTVICSKHFDHIPDTMDYEKYVPSARSNLAVSGKRRRQRIELRGLLDRMTHGQGVNDGCSDIEVERSASDEIGGNGIPCDSAPQPVEEQPPLLMAVGTVREETPILIEMKDACTQTEDPPAREEMDIIDHMVNLELEITRLKLEVLQLKKLLEKNEMACFESELMGSDDICKFYTGLTVSQLKALKSFCAVSKIRYWGSETVEDSKTNPNNRTRLPNRKLTNDQDLLLLFLRLRGGLLVEDIAFRFKLSASYISRAVTTWIQVLYEKFDNVRPYMFPSQNIIMKNLPSRFKRFKNIRIIIDCAEIPCETPASFEQQGNCYSNYKAHTTYKFLIGCTPNGVVSFVSDVMEWSIHDREIVEKSGLIDLLEPGDLVLADRGFTIRDLTDEKGVILNIPAFLRGRDRLTPQEEVATKEIAANRIFVEHVVGRLKNFRIFHRTIPLCMNHVLSRIVFICACLINFQEPLVT